MHCPACGAANPEDARFCKDCQTRLPESARRTVTGVEELPAAPFEVKTDTGLEGEGMSMASVFLGFLGIPGIIAGAIALRKRSPGRSKALAGIVIGSVTTVVLAIVLIVSLTSGDPLHRNVNARRLPGFVTLVNARADRIQEQATELGARLGPGAQDELAPVYGLLEQARTLAAAMDTTWTDEELNAARDTIVTELDAAREYLTGR